MTDEFEDYQDENEDFQIEAESSDYLHFSEDKRRLVSLCWVAYKYTHTNEDGVAQYVPIAIINGDENAAQWLEGKDIRYLRISCEV